MLFLIRTSPISSRVPSIALVSLNSAYLTRALHNTNANNDFLSWVKSKTRTLIKGEQKPVDNTELPEIKTKLYKDSNELLKNYQQGPQTSQIVKKLELKQEEEEEHTGLNSNLASAEGEKIDISKVQTIGLPSSPTYPKKVLKYSKIDKWYSSKTITTESELNDILINAYKTVFLKDETNQPAKEQENEIENKSENKNLDSDSQPDFEKIFKTKRLTDLQLRFNLFKEISIQTGIPIPDDILTRTATINHLKEWYLTKRLSYAASHYNESLPNAIYITNEMFESLGNVHVLPDYSKKKQKHGYKELLEAATDFQSKKIQENIRNAKAF
ncbi:mitochondrial 54S ribosomal protein mL50 MRPL13 ASCRUDRAFT_75165 [Ascoidea rubescens DSM 1968]|uniref:Large ribosomal subunit protein mL50 n=1 Tax=Ascoidea rubescens DSM 1968 TaxID=1344418 RepID=A0A1D2VJY6_9ASCO|nr:hypothetical protein ASCRUDRAFT_75165 [Ascoidea rubescens DSM 1968]ODV61910.1 hypothetical protein ASCRUDRAFT_75165 [Ascoidea rubescens DSM 1968]